jgi:hypothetical protein
MTTPEDLQKTAMVYRWTSNETILPAWAFTWCLVGFMRAATWLLVTIARHSGPGRWARGVREEMAKNREETGSLFHMSRFYRFHHSQVIWFQLVYMTVGLLTCGLSLLLGFPWYIMVMNRAHAATLSGQWHRLPLVGRWSDGPEHDSGA